MSTLRDRLALIRKRQIPIDEEGPRESQSPVNTIMMRQPSQSNRHVPWISLAQLVNRSQTEQSSSSASQQSTFSGQLLVKKRQRQLDGVDSGPVAKRVCVSNLSSSTPSGKPKHEVSATNVQKPVKGSGSNSVGTLYKNQQSSIKPCTSNRHKNLPATYEPSSPRTIIFSYQQIDEGTRDNYGTRPWQRLKKGADGSKWQYDVKSRDGNSGKSQDLSDEIAWSIVRASSRNKKHHLRRPLIAESDSDDDDDDSSILSQESTRSYDSSSTVQSYRSSSLRARGEDFVYEDFMRTQEETMYVPKHSTDGFTNEHVSDIPEDEFPESQKTRELQAQIKALTEQNKRQGAQIRALTTKDEIPRGRTGDLEWQLLCKPDGKLIELGSGSYGRVYKGLCKSTGKFLAVKVVQDLNNKKAADVLEKEMKQLGSLEPHDRIVTYLGTCYAKHPSSNVMSLYVFTEFMPGGSLSSFLTKMGPLPERIMWRFTRQILEGVDYLHKCGIIHRDIKGSNIMCKEFSLFGLLYSIHHLHPAVLMSIISLLFEELTN